MPGQGEEIPELSDLVLPDWLNVSRETLESFQTYIALVMKWQKTVNLVQFRNPTELWERHFLDCAQCTLYLKNREENIIDVGSGAGFPGMVLALMGYRLTLVEAIAKKASFLKEVARQTETKVGIITGRVEQIDRKFDVIISRAMAPMKRFLRLTKSIYRENSTYYLMKGERWEEEINSACDEWKFELDIFPSMAQSGSVIIKLWNVSSKRV